MANPTAQDETNNEKEQIRNSQRQFPENVTFDEEVVLITGGSGFLGQHIIRVLQERANGIKEIRVVDIVPYHKKLDFEEIHPVEFYDADITIVDQLDKAFNGATCVIHSAAIVNVGHFVDKNKMRSVNIIGTKNIILKCRQWNIGKLILSSTVDAVFTTSSKFVNQTECQTELGFDENEILMGYYGFSKAQAEAFTICARNYPLSNGKKLTTVILRPTVIYGELDPHYVPITLKVAKSCGGYLCKPAIFRNQPVLQSTYAGNVAWAHILALYKLCQEAQNDDDSHIKVDDKGQTDRVDGETLFVNDDTHPTSIYNFMKPFLELRGYKSLLLPVPYYFVLLLVTTANIFVRHLFPVSWKKWLDCHPSLPTYEGFLMAHSQISLNRLKLTNCLDYQPIYSESEAFQRSAQYYKNLTL